MGIREEGLQTLFLVHCAAFRVTHTAWPQPRGFNYEFMTGTQLVCLDCMSTVTAGVKGLALAVTEVAFLCGRQRDPLSWGWCQCCAPAKLDILPLFIFKTSRAILKIGQTCIQELGIQYIKKQFPLNP